MTRPSTLARSISPPPSRRTSYAHDVEFQDQDRTKLQDQKSKETEPKLASIEAGKAQVEDHLAYFSKHLAQAQRSTSGPRISIDQFRNLYQRNQHQHGRHFVIHQHDHPISGVHYDLRLQFSATSTISFAIPYGMPGNPNSIRPNRMAIETRVHNLWNNLIESASHVTGSLLIWDTGEYEVLPWNETREPMTDDEQSDSASDADQETDQSESDRLFAAFQARHIRLRLRGTRLPSGYTVSLRLPSANDMKNQPDRPKRKRRRMEPHSAAAGGTMATLGSRGGASTSTDSEVETNAANRGPAEDTSIVGKGAAQASEDEAGEDALIRETNAYTGASNTIGSVHQRRWFLTLDRRNSGFVKSSPKTNVNSFSITAQSGRRDGNTSSSGRDRHISPLRGSSSRRATPKKDAKPDDVGARSESSGIKDGHAVGGTASVPLDEPVSAFKTGSKSGIEDDLVHHSNGGGGGGRRCAWVGGTWQAFFVRGREAETSVITGRSADDVMADEGVEKFVGRKMWRPILE